MVRSGVRPTGERGIGWFLFLSLCLHVIVVILLVLHRKPTTLGYQTATTVALIPENQLVQPGTPPPAAPPAPPVKKVRPAPPPPPPPHPQRQALSPRVIRTPPVHKPQQKPVPRRVKKPVPAHKVSHPKPVVKRARIMPVKSQHQKQPRNPQASKAAIAPVANTPPVHMDLAGNHFPTYLQHLLIARIKSNWAPPPGSHGLYATIRFILLKDGQISGDPVLTTPSGSRVFDDAARYAILRSIPFPPFPPSYGKEKEVVTVTLQATKRQGF
ncbi:MAG: TonB C-terminal domain-containing protein [Leptospirillia bacterium]